MKRCNLAYANAGRTALVCRSGRRADEASSATLCGPTARTGAERRSVRDRRHADRTESGPLPVGSLAGHSAAAKLNVLLTVASDMPTFCTRVEGRRHDVNFPDEVSFR
jgi:hypothetical protein